RKARAGGGRGCTRPGRRRRPPAPRPPTPFRFPTLVPRLQVSSPTVILDLMTEVTRILGAIDQGDPHAAEQLLPLIYDELRQLASQKLAHEKLGQTLDATALVHEAYLRLVTAEQGETTPAGDRRWANCRHFFATAAEAMRRI